MVVVVEFITPFPTVVVLVVVVLFVDAPLFPFAGTITVVEVGLSKPG